MVNGYNPKSCSALEKPFYKPIEVAIRWCGLIQHETKILSAVGEATMPRIDQFPQWPCLRANTEKVIDAIQHGDLVYGRDGAPVAIGEHVARHRLTIRHSDLKAWMVRNYPDQKPAFLFDEIERTTHAAINADSFRALQSERDALKVRIKKATEAYRTLKHECDTIISERDSLKAKVDKMAAPSERAETTYLNIIGGLLGLMLGKSPAGKQQSIFNNQAAIISALLGHYEGKSGISARTLEEKFAAAKRSLSSS